MATGTLAILNDKLREDASSQVKKEETDASRPFTSNLPPDFITGIKRKIGSWGWVATFVAFADRQIPANLRADPEMARRGRLITEFGTLGSIFGLAYATFYLLIGHRWGGAIVLVSTMGVALTPSLMRCSRSIDVAGHFFSLVLTLGFVGLCFVEGGVHGHSIAWLANVPLCALLLLGTRGAIIWASIVFACTSLVVGIDVTGINLPLTYDPRWNSVVSAAGYMGLIVFMFALGLIFENGRARAQVQLQRALKNLASSHERLVFLNQEKNEFLNLAAHDLKNPLMAISANGEMLKIERDPAEIAAMVDGIIAAAERMRSLVTNLLDVNAIEEGRFASKVERCDMGSLVRQIVEQNTPASILKQIRIESSVAEGLFIQTDPAAATQILDNLISNAVKYSPRGGTVYVCSAIEQTDVVVSVRDEGPGISEEDQKKLFQKYSRLTARPTGGESSNGLGLAIAKRLADMLSRERRLPSDYPF
jgi:signal transduction histidine kinase